MPTNKLWIEHTERAAWESVQALREKLADAERRMQRLAPPAEGWKSLLDALDAAGASGLPQGSGFAEMLRAVLDRMTSAETRVRVLEDELSRVRESQARQSLERRPSERAGAESGSDDGDEDDDLEPAERASRRFLRALERRQRELGSSIPSGPSGLLAAIEAHVDDLSETEEANLSESALELGVLALCLERAARRAARDLP